jgi:short-subunit dehydrogenase
MMRRWIFPILVGGLIALGAYQATLLATPYALMFAAMNGNSDMVQMLLKSGADRRLKTKFGYDAMMKGKQVVIHGILNKFLAFIVRFTPRVLVVKISRKVIDK